MNGDFYDSDLLLTSKNQKSDCLNIHFNQNQWEGGRTITSLLDSKVKIINPKLANNSSLDKTNKIPIKPFKTGTKKLLTEAILNSTDTENELSLLTMESNDYKDAASVLLISEDLEFDSPSYLEAKNSPDAEMWRDAIRSELDSQERNGTWTLSSK